MLEINKIYNEDCLEGMKRIDDKSIDCIICDLPYGTTQCKWDTIIPFEPLWGQYNRIIKDDGAIVLFGSEPFSSNLRISNMKMWKYDWIWIKNKSSNFINCKYQPLKNYEIISVFSKSPSTYSKNKNMNYYPQELIKLDIPKIQKRTAKRTGEIYHSCPNVETVQKYSNYPILTLKYNVPTKVIHPTQKPVDLLEYLIKTYTNADDLILDNCIGSGTTAVAAINENRNYIGFEMNKEYFDIANNRVSETLGTML